MKHLVIAPHADDEVLGTGGSVDKYISRGEEVHLVICGLRAHDSINHIDIATEKYTSVFQFTFEDELYYCSFDEILKSIEDVYNNIKPDSVFVPNKDDFNRDHRCIYEVCEIVCRRYQEHSTNRILMYEIPSSTTQSFNNNFKCNYYESLTKQNIERKIDTFLHYKNEYREYPNPRSKLGIETYARFRGMESSTDFAEGFNLLYCKS